jgi:uncharacterized protein YciI
MRYILFIIWFLSIIQLSFGQEPSDSAAAFETFEYKSEDSIYIMQKYFLVFLKRGTAPSEDLDVQMIQKGHLDYLGSLFKKGIICMNGPFGDDGNIRGATVYRVPNQEEAERLAGEDPAVKAGLLEIEVHPWWLARGTGVY